MSVKKRDIQFKSSDGQTMVAAYFYEDDTTPPKAVVQISHGMCEYIGRYDGFAAYLCSRGFAVCGNDHLGHGATSTQETDGFFGPTGSRRFVLEDLHEMNRLAHEQYPGLPVVLLGHSMGSFFAREYAARWPGTINALLISGTGGPNPVGGVGLALTSLLGALRGHTYRSKFINNLAFGAYLKRIPEPNTPYDWITRDEEIVAKYAADPKCTFIFTVGGFHELMSILKEVSSPAWAAKLDKQMPVLLASGAMDPVGEYGEGVKKVYSWLQQAGLQHAELRLYPDARHELINEINRADLWKDLADWMQQQTVGAE